MRAAPALGGLGVTRSGVPGRARLASCSWSEWSGVGGGPVKCQQTESHVVYVHPAVPHFAAADVTASLTAGRRPAARRCCHMRRPAAAHARPPCRRSARRPEFAARPTARARMRSRATGRPPSGTCPVPAQHSNHASPLTAPAPACSTHASACARERHAGRCPARPLCSKGGHVRFVVHACAHAHDKMGVLVHTTPSACLPGVPWTRRTACCTRSGCDWAPKGSPQLTFLPAAAENLFLCCTAAEDSSRNSL